MATIRISTAELEREESESMAEMDAYDDEFLSAEKAAFFESYQVAVQDCIDRRCTERGR